MYIERVRKGRNMPFIKIGMRVRHTYNGKYGRISGGNSSLNLNITFDGDNYSINCHPKWEMEYYDKNGEIIAKYSD